MRYSSPFVLLCLTILLVQCDKDEESAPIEMEPAENNIIVVDITPDIVFELADTVYFHPSNCGDLVPFPTTALEEVELDIDDDGTADIYIEYENSYTGVSASDPCVNYVSTLSMSGLSGTSTPSTSPPGFVEALSFSDPLESVDFSDSYGILYLHGYNLLNWDEFEGTNYLGFRLSGGNLGWLKLSLDSGAYILTIEEYGYNDGPGGTLFAGQSQ